MSDITLSDYFCGDEEMRFTHFRIPRQLITHPQFKPLSADAKLLYGMLLDRMSLSAKNGWQDNTGRVYIYFTIKEVCEAIGCGRNKAIRLLAELDTSKGIGLIERIKQGQGKPDKIFVKRITVRKDTEMPCQGSAAPISEGDFSNVQRSEKPASSSRKNRPLEVSTANPNYIDINHTDFIYTNQSINPPAPSVEQPRMDASREGDSKKISCLMENSPLSASYSVPITTDPHSLFAVWHDFREIHLTVRRILLSIRSIKNSALFFGGTLITHLHILRKPANPVLNFPNVRRHFLQRHIVMYGSSPSL